VRIPVAIAMSIFAVAAQEPPGVTFGTTVVGSSDLRGDIYLLKPHTGSLPRLGRMKPVGTIYTNTLQVTPRNFVQGFPGVTGQFEWFAIRYNGRFWIETDGRYQFRVLSDDGSKLWIDGELLVDNDGIHPPAAVDGSAVLSRGVHELRLEYFQGPRAHVALVLSIAGPGNGNLRPFDTRDYLPPADRAEWVKGRIRDKKRGANW
jgi:hypothetical protein